MAVTLEEINAKLDKILLLLNNGNDNGSNGSNGSNVGNDIEKHEWSADIVGNYIIIKFPFNNEFKDFVKSIGCFWSKSKKGWMFPLSDKDQIIE